MNLYFRVLWLILRFPWIQRQSDPLAISTLTMRVMPNDLDFNLHVNNGRYLTLMDLGRLYLMSVTGLLRPTLKRGWLPMLGSVKVHFIRPLKIFDAYQMTTQVVYWDEKWIYLEQKILKKDILCLVALVKTLFVDNKNEKIPPKDLLSVLTVSPQQPPVPNTIKFWIEAEKASRD